MPGMLLYRLDATDSKIQERLDKRHPAVEVNQQQFFDGLDLYHGRLADKRISEQDVAYGTAEGIVAEPDDVPEYVDAQWLIAPETGLAGISTAAAERTLKDVCLKDLGTPPREAEVDLESFVDVELDGQRADVWAVSYSDDEDGVDPTRAGARYHNDARLSDLELGDVSLLGIDLVWEGRAVQALVCESGWVAAHEDDMTMTQFTRWVHDCVGPHLHEPLAGAEQATLGGGSA